jgi:hypothetical protein
MKKIIYLIILLFGLLTINTSCDDVGDSVLQEEYRKVVLLQSNGVVIDTIYNTGRDTDYNFTVIRSGQSPELPVDATVSIMNAEEFQTYCTDHGLNLTPYPADCYQLPAEALNFESNERYKIVGLTLHTDKINELQSTDTEYAIPMVLTSPNATVNSEKNVLFVRPHVAPPIVRMGLTGFQSYSYKPGEEVQSIAVEFPIKIDFDNYWDISCNITSTQDALDAYNAAEGTFYTLLPAESFTLNSPVVIKEGEGTTTSKLNVDGTKLSYGNYVLPVVLESASKFEVDATRNTYLIGIFIEAPVLNKTGWTVKANSVAFNESIGSANALIDGDPSTYWHSRWGSSGEGATNQLPYEWIIDMKEEKTITQIDFQQRVGSSYKDSRNMKVYISSDNSTWALIGSLTAVQIEGMQPFGLLKSQGRYVKVVIETSYRASNASMAEVDIHGF